ncbi:acidic repeat-containing protein-like, partial [Asbolus verrucosus]
PTKLALKKYFRRSSIVTNTNNSLKNESVITVESNSSRSESSGSPILISDSETSFNSKNSPIVDLEHLTIKCNGESEHNDAVRLSHEKYTKIKLWVDEVNSAKQNASVFNEVSSIYGENNSCFKAPTMNVMANSTFLKTTSKRFDELFKTRSSNSVIHKNKAVESKNIFGDAKGVINDSLMTEDNSLQENFKSLMTVDSSLAENCKNMVLEDSFQLDLNESLSTRIQKKQSKGSGGKLKTPEKSISSPGEYENLLDSLYGKSWREKKEEILPSSEPRLKKKDSRQKAPNTEKPIKISNIYKNPYINENDSNNLLKILQKARFKNALESPWSKSLKNICDSDTDSDDDTNKLQPTKLNFKDDENSDSVTGNSLNKVQIKTTKLSNALEANKKKKSDTGCDNFLASLSGSVPISRCDMSALIYRTNFKKHRDHLAAKLFKLYNESIFDNAIPQDTPLEWNDRMRGTAGYCYCRKITRRTGAIERAVRIVLSTKVLDSPDRLRDTLVHEMCHAVTWIVNKISDGHGAFWKSWADRAIKTFPELPPIKRCHQYIINTKYTYRCTSCGYSIGRHTKSLDVERKRCGYCLGTFEILINKTTKKGETKSVPATPKKAATGFALFVKENYATHKTPDLKHGDVMKILGKKFSSLKVDQS